MRKKLLLLLIGITSIAFISNAQAKIDREGESGGLPTDGGIYVFQGKQKVRSSGVKYSFAYAKGDKVVLKYTTNKDKKLKEVWFANAQGQKLWSQSKPASLTKEFNINKEGVYTIGLFAKGMGARDTEIEIIRKPGRKKDYNTAWMIYKIYTPKEVKYTIDSMIGYKEPIITQNTFKVFDKYLYQNVEFYYLKKQILGQGGVHNSQAKGYSMNIDPNKVPKNGKLKGYTYSLSSKIGGADHWAIADITVTVGALFLSPAGSFAAHGAMALIGPQPGNEPVQYFLSNRQSDIKVVREIYSLYNKGRKASNIAKDKAAAVARKISNAAANKILKTKVKYWTEGDLSFNQKGKVTNLLMYSATAPKNKWFIMGNPDIGQAKNVKLRGSAIYYAPTYKNLKCKEYFYDVKSTKLEKSKIQTSKTITYGSIKH